MNGFVLNRNIAFFYFDLMIFCGIKDKAVTSWNVVELGKTKVDMAEVKQKLLRHFETLFEAELVKQETSV
ncbi:hypothetical protein [Maribacter sp. 2210JD10-5]|uniref:hypothetical protein n=1 Tax=Maribacter sp. 2210JD10-5 TaxID=3386272 RepID=UPI0039BCF543